MRNRDREIWGAVGGIIRETRKARGLTLKALAALAEVDWSQLSKLERGTSRVADATLERIGHELGFTLPALYAAAFAQVRPVDGCSGGRTGRASAARLVRRPTRDLAGKLPDGST